MLSDKVNGRFHVTSLIFRMRRLWLRMRPTMWSDYLASKREKERETETARGCIELKAQ